MTNAIGAISGNKSEATSFLKAQDKEQKEKEKNGGQNVAYASLPGLLNGSLHAGASQGTQTAQTAFNA